MITVTAPGKLFITGEYAVLGNAPALLSAVDVRATCRLEPARDAIWRLHAPPVTGAPRAFCIRDGEIAWEGEPLPLVDAAWRALDAKRRLELAKTAWNITLDTSAFFIKDRKLGLGSSAAAMTALLGAFWSASGGLPALEDGTDLLVRAHGDWQGKGHGRGSGADVAVALSGGTVLYRREPRIVAPVSLPDGLDILPVWTGESASTGDFLRRLEDFRATSPERYADCLAVLEQMAEEAAVAAAEGNVAVLLDGINAGADALQGLGEASGLEIWSETHRRIAARLAEIGVSYKPSGAGGGDIGLAVFTKGDESTGDRVKSVLSSIGHEILPLRFGARGLHATGTGTDE